VRGPAALLAILLTSACSREDDATRTITIESASTVTVTETTTAVATAAEPPEAWEVPVPLPADGSLPANEFNAYAEGVDEPWERDLRATVDEFISLGDLEAPYVSFQAASGPEGEGPTNVSILLDGLLDDSVRSRSYDLTLSRRADGTWRIDAASWAQRCQQGRGHQGFTPAKCL
jgi:hypothetical protein